MASDWHVPGFTSTGSKRPEALFGLPAEACGELPTRLVRAAGCRVWDARGRAYTDYLMALGAVALGYGHPEVSRAAAEALAAGVTGPLPPVLEEELAAALAARIPWLEQVRFLKTGAEAVAAAVRLARVVTGRDRVLGCGYHGWLDWCQGGPGVPAAVRALYAELPFDDGDATRHLLRAAGDAVAAVVVEPVGAAERYGVRPDLAVFGKALANGFPLAVVGGRAELMAAAGRTWISATVATESVALAAARATLDVFVRDAVCAHLQRVGARLFAGLRRLHGEHPHLVA